MPTPFTFRGGIVLLLFSAAVIAARAQIGVYAEDGDNFVLVRAAHGMSPLIEKDGKLVKAKGLNLATKEVPEYAPYYIAIRDFNVNSTYMTLNDSSSEINNDFHLQANLVSPYSLHNVFLLLDLKTDRAGKNYFLWEIGDMNPNQPKWLSLTLPLNSSLGSGKYVLHLFVNGLEVFHSRMPFAHIEHVLDKMVQRRTQNLVDAPPQPFVGPSPEFPAQFKGKHVKGQALLRFEVSTTGRVHDPVVESASDPAFGDAALNAIRQWRFLPKMVHGAPMITIVRLPFVFPEQ